MTKIKYARFKGKLFKVKSLNYETKNDELVNIILERGSETYLVIHDEEREEVKSLSSMTHIGNCKKLIEEGMNQID